jgi:hypothetical protein
MTTAEIYESIYDAMAKGDVARFGTLLDEHPEIRRYEDGRDRWLGEVATEGLLSFVQLLVKRGTM